MTPRKKQRRKHADFALGASRLLDLSLSARNRQQPERIRKPRGNPPLERAFLRNQP